VRLLVVLLVALLVPVPARAAEPRPDVSIEIREEGSEHASALAEAVAHILVDTGRPVTLARPSSAECARCVRVLLRREGAAGFAIEARYGRATRTSVLVLPGSASTFDLTHALAIQVELLVDEVVRAGRPPRVAAAPVVPAPVVPAPAPAVVVVEREPAPIRPRAASAVVVPRGVERTTQVARQRERIAFQVEATALGAPTGGFFTYGLALAVRVLVSERVDVRLRLAMLDPDRTRSEEGHGWRNVHPLALYATTSVPRLEELRVGAGAELVDMIGETAMDERARGSSLGGLATAEYRWRVRGFVARASLCGALHPFDDALAVAGQTLLDYPEWTVSASMGFEFRLW
jgi:hypothetical protein